MVEVRVRGGLELEEFAAEVARVDCEGACWRRAVGEGLREEGVVGERCVSSLGFRGGGGAALGGALIGGRGEPASWL